MTTINPTPQTQPGAKEPDIIDRIGNALPPDLQKDYFKEMRYLRNLQETDELLRIIRIMQFLALLAEQVPSRILAQRELFDSICREVIEIVKKLLVSESKYFGELDRRLTQLPADIARGISPQAIVEQINGILKKLFEATTIPTVAAELNASAGQIKASANEFTKASEKLTGSWNSATDKANTAIEKIDGSISKIVETVGKAAKTAKEGAEALSNSFKKSYYWIFWSVGIFGIVVGILIGLLIPDHWRDKLLFWGKPSPEIKTVVQPANVGKPPAKPSSGRGR